MRLILVCAAVWSCLGTLPRVLWLCGGKFLGQKSSRWC